MRTARTTTLIFPYLDAWFFELMDDAASDHGVCSTINRWMDFVRSVFVDVRGVRLHTSVRRGCPQRSVLSSLLWNMVEIYQYHL
jgi:hypothetical protein